MTRTVLLLALFAALPAQAEPSRLRGAADVLGGMGSTAAARPASGGAPALLQDVRTFRAEGANLGPEQAARRWLELYDRARALPAQAGEGDAASFDVDVRAAVGLSSVIAALPPAGAWDALRAAAVERAKRQPGRDALALRALAELLVADRTALAGTLGELDQLAKKLAPAARKSEQAKIDRVRRTVEAMVGTPEQVAASFMAGLEGRDEDYQFSDLELPDLVGMVGPAKARTMLLTALARPVKLVANEGDDTRVLARQLALESAPRLRVAQWGLVDGPDAAPLYEALAKRFDKAAAADDADPAAIGMDRYDTARQTADAYYFVHLVTAKRQAEAERALARLISSGQNELPKRAIEALQRMGEDEALYQFLHALLATQPELQAWDLFLREAARTGHGADALALIESLLARPGLPDYLRTRLLSDRTNALFALDRLDDGIAGLRAQLTAAPDAKDATLDAKFRSALRLAAIGRVLGRADVGEAGLSYARRAFALEAPAGAQGVSRDQGFPLLSAELRKQGQVEVAQALAISELARPSRLAAQLGADVADAFDPGARTRLIELVGLYHAEHRSTDVLLVFDAATRWGARDLGEFVAAKDSLGVPAGLMAARALRDAGNTAKALVVLDALIRELPGHDAAYELYVDIDPKAAIATFDAIYARDQFEERPLIWKAIALTRDGRYEEAELSIKAAILIDPSDGEQGPNDRMRAYSVLADILDAKGDDEGAKLYRGAVSAIRISERTDELHAHGLYMRAFAGYDEALMQFSDAYCIQSRLAVQLSKQGRHEAAMKHYRRAFELMPGSFGRVESHCFGCESVFQGAQAQSVAEQVFTEAIRKDPGKAQTHYMLGYLRQEQGRYREALQHFRDAVSHDGEYLNAWRHLHEVAQHTYVEPTERDIARLKLLALDPGQRHVRYELNGVTNLALLRRGAEQAERVSAAFEPMKVVYPLEASAAKIDQAMAVMPEGMRAQFETYKAYNELISMRPRAVHPNTTLASQVAVAAVANLMGANGSAMIE